MWYIQFGKFLDAKTLRDPIGEALEIHIECISVGSLSQTIDLKMIPDDDGKFRPQATIYYEYKPFGFNKEKVIGVGNLADGYATLPIEPDSENDFDRLKSVLKAMLP
jgi:hypothetical protein